MERTPKLIFGVSSIVVLIIGLGAYAYFQFKDFLGGPVLMIEQPENGYTSTTSRVALEGVARNVAFITLNGRPIFTDEFGRFKESLLLPDGYSIMTLEARDRFGHTAKKRLELVYKPVENLEFLVPNP